jgi:hypothetical protein
MRNREAENVCLDHLLAGQIDTAVAYAAEHGGAATSKALIVRIMHSSPTILRSVPPTALHILRIGAAMMELWGTNRCAQWMPQRLKRDLAMDADAAARMVNFSAQHFAHVADYQGAEQVEWNAAPDSCRECAAMNGRRFPPTNVPELPYERCTHHMGCRCLWLPIVTFDSERKT